MDREIPVKAWLPILAGCALLPLVVLQRMVLVPALLGLSAYLVFTAIRAFRWRLPMRYKKTKIASGCVLAFIAADLAYHMPSLKDIQAANARINREVAAKQEAKRKAAREEYERKNTARWNAMSEEEKAAEFCFTHGSADGLLCSKYYSRLGTKN